MEMVTALSKLGNVMVIMIAATEQMNRPAKVIFTISILLLNLKTLLSLHLDFLKTRAYLYRCP